MIQYLVIAFEVSHALRYLRNGGKEESLGIISPYDSQAGGVCDTGIVMRKPGI